MARRIRETFGEGSGSTPLFRSLTDLPEPGHAPELEGRGLNICVVTSEILGPIKNGGIGTATSALVDRLAATGHQVTILFTQVFGGRPLCQQDSWDQWVVRLQEQGVRLTAIKHQGSWNAWREKSWAVKSYLERHDFDLVYFNEHHASGFYPMMAKHAGLAPFKNQVHAVITHGSMEWVAQTNDQPPLHVNDVAMALMERRCVEWADTVIGPSAYLLETYRGYGWQLPTETYVQPYLLGSKTGQDEAESAAIDELVFFGRLEHRKGLWMFCQALDRLAAQGLCPKVTFLGRMTPVGGTPSGALLLARAARWPFKIRLLTNYGQEEALAYLSHPSRLAVMPSLADNSPCVVYECIERSLPFVTCSGSGADEIIAADDHPNVLAEPTAEALANQLSHCLDKGASSARLAFDAEENLAAWDRWHRRIKVSKTASTDQPAAKPNLPQQAESRRLIILVDDPDLPLSDVFAAIADNARRLANNSDFALLSPRSGLLAPWLDQMLEILAHAAGTSIRRLGTGDLEEALTQRACVVITAVSARAISATIDQCSTLTGGKKNVITSCLPTGRPDNPVVQNHALPFGEIPELAAFNEPLTGGICVTDGAIALSYLPSAMHAATVHGDWPSSSDVCEDVVTRHLANGGRYQLLPQAGIAVGAPPTNGARQTWHRRAKLSASLSGFDPLSASALPVWMAISSAWSAKAAKQETAKDPAGSPEKASLAIRAAQLRRLDLATDCAAEGDTAELERVRQAALQAIRSVEPIDFLPDILAGANQSDDAHRSGPQSNPSSVTVLFGGSDPMVDLAVREASMKVTFPRGDASQSMLVVFDMTLEGQHELTVCLEGPALERSAPVSADIVLVDQVTGTPVLPPFGPVAVSGTSRLSIPLAGISARVTLMLTIGCDGGPAPSSCQISTIRAR